MKAFNIWVTRRCNLRCKYCYEGIEKRNLDFSKENIGKLIDFIRCSSINEPELTINFHGGEPLLRLDIIKAICDRLNEFDIPARYSLTTNALLLNESIISTIMEYKIYLSISLDGDKVSNDSNRIDMFGNGTYERVVKNAQRVAEMGLNPRIRMTVTPNNVHSFYYNIEHLLELGFKNIVAVPDFFDKYWDDEKIELLKTELIRVKEKEVAEDVSITFFKDNISKKGLCAGGIVQCNIDVDMLVYPCTYGVGDIDLSIGNIIDGIDKSKNAVLMELNQKENIECRGCTYGKYCTSTRCKILNKVLTGDYLGTSPVICELENVFYQVYHD
ncbi:radical SAM protein [Acetivibrio mesophilus]|uniref:Radical SAM protein n=1 Tax=Acetivibrio mesophilus TaxID=2487273 RepID=A0A4Q0I3D3_9FIRM|nr:radical SAM protein [Acetivibrio mesophilus]ODM27227.1 hypothetical protein A7W90_13965 [Clostridium sp. Bc-iso-3]RXE58738.1 radical SAM protein [Acetivibrio mesophilus]